MLKRREAIAAEPLAMEENDKAEKERHENAGCG